MTGLVLDASITAAWCFEDETTQYARGLLKQSRNIAFMVPAIWPLEMTNVLLVNERKKRISASDTVRFVTLLGELGIQVDRPTLMQPFEATLLLARTYGLSAYDASYLELAIRNGLRLATLDARLGAAAAAAGVPLYE